MNDCWCLVVVVELVREGGRERLKKCWKIGVCDDEPLLLAGRLTAPRIPFPVCCFVLARTRSAFAFWLATGGVGILRATETEI